MEPHDDTRQDDLGALSPTSTYVTLEEAILLFENAGVFRSLRTLSRYCQHDVLDCTKEEMLSGAMRYLVTKESVSNRILEIQQLGASGHVQSRRDMSGHDDTEKKALEERVKELEQEKEQLREENTDLKIDVGSNKAMLKQALETYDRFMKERDSLLKYIGLLETQVKQIAPPRNEPPTTFEEGGRDHNPNETPDNEHPHEPVPNPV